MTRILICCASKSVFTGHEYIGVEALLLEQAKRLALPLFIALAVAQEQVENLACVVNQRRQS